MNLILCIHNHQPVGNMDFILEEAYTRAYGPFLEVLKDFPRVKINLHFSGYLFSWLQTNKANYINLLKTLVRKGQIEIVSGGMYEPVLSLVSEEDAVSQIALHRDFMEEVFGVRPQGMWLAERVWEPHMPRTLSRAGIAYTMVDDHHFKSVGVNEDDLFGYFVTEHEGHKLAVFPGLEFLRYAVPFKPLELIDEYFRGVAQKGGSLAVFGDDGEKFGLWPGTHASVYDEKWLQKFFVYLSENKAWLKTVTFGECLSQRRAGGLVYLDCQSYKEMGEWSLPAGLARDYEDLASSKGHGLQGWLKGGYFKNFLVKYPESNDMHKKMLAITRKTKRHEQARKRVFMAQCNDSYWHGVFGGLYLPHLRASVYRNLIEAEALMEPENPFVEGRLEDVNLDGQEEAVLNNNKVKAYFLLNQGGALYELDYKPAAVNIMANLTRRYEAYHEKIKVGSSQASDGTKTIHDLVMAKEEGLDRYLHYDWYRRASLIDHVMSSDVSLESVYRCEHVEPGDFAREAYSGAIRKGRKWVRLDMRRQGLFRQGNARIPLSIEKTAVLHEGESALSVDYRIDGEVREPFCFGVEFNFSFLGSGGDRSMETEYGRRSLTTREIIRSCSGISLNDPYQGLRVVLKWGTPAEIWTFPVEIVSLSENGFERNYQSTMVMPVWSMDLRSGPKRLGMRLELHGIGHHNDL
jgi:4-alpha-glucanotransferase